MTGLERCPYFRGVLIERFHCIVQFWPSRAHASIIARVFPVLPARFALGQQKMEKIGV